MKKEPANVTICVCGRNRLLRSPSLSMTCIFLYCRRTSPRFAKSASTLATVVRRLSAADACSINYLWSIMAAICAAVVLHERIKATEWMAILLSYVIMGESVASYSVVGMLLVLGGSLLQLIKIRYSGVSIFSTKVQCAECGGWYGSKVWHSNDKYRRIIYWCNNKFRNKRYDGLVKRYDEAKARYDAVVAVISVMEAQSERLSDFIKVLKAQDGIINEFDGSLWGGMVEFAMVGRDKAITVTFRDDTEIQA